MKIKDGYMLRNVAGKYIVVPVGEETMDFNGIITTNETGAFLWKSLENEISQADLLKAFLNEYEIDEQIAAEDLSDFIKKLSDADLLT